jgi:hypothetical protein
VVLAVGACVPVDPDTRPAPAAKARAGLPRIGVKDCGFIDTETRQVFHPIGFNYIRLQQHPEVPTADWHSPFGVGDYSHEDAERMFTLSRQYGFNVTRVFLSHYNLAPLDDGKNLNPGVMTNLVDFLELAREHETYVILTTCYHLPSEYYDSLGEDEDTAQDWNGHYLNDRIIMSKVAYVGQLVREIKDRAPELLSTVLAYDLDNEVQFTMKYEPFKGGGRFEFLGETYDLDKSSEIQRLMDVSITHWINLCSDAVKVADPEAMVSASVFDFKGIGRMSGPGRAREQKSKQALADARIPARPLVIAKSKADYVDIHTYIYMGPTGADLDCEARLLLHSVEYNRLVEACRENGKPLLAGEFGVLRRAIKAPELAGERIVEQVNLLAGHGFAGYLLWTFDGHWSNGDWEKEHWWPGTAKDNTILKIISASISGTPWRHLRDIKPILQFDNFSDARFEDPQDKELTNLTINVGGPMPITMDGIVIFRAEDYKVSMFEVDVAASGKGMGNFGKGLYSTWNSDVSCIRIRVSPVSFGPDSVIVGGHHHMKDAPDRVKLIGEWHDDYWTTPGKGKRAIWQTGRLSEGEYDVYVHVGDDPNKDHATKATCKLEYGGKQHWFSVNQRTMANRWVRVDRFPLDKKARIIMFAEKDTGNYVADSIAFKPAGEETAADEDYRVKVFFPVEANRNPFGMTINGKDLGVIEAVDLKRIDQHTAFIESIVSTSSELVIESTGETKPSVSCVKVEKR